MANGKKIRRKKGSKQRLLTLDEVFNEVSVSTSSSLTPNVSQLVLTPLSSEACLKHGINPDALRQRPFGSFWEPNVETEIQRIRYESYEKRRHDLMKLATEEKNKLIRKRQNRNVDNSYDFSCSDTLSQSHCAHSTILEEQSRMNETLIDVEAKRLEKAKARQKRELLQMLQFEKKTGEIQAEMRAKAEREALLEEKKKRNKAIKERRAAEDKRIKNLRRKAQEDAEEEMKKIAARESYKKERRLQKLQERQKIEEKRRLKILEQEREKKRETHKLKTENFLEEQRQQAELKMKEREQKDKEWKDMIEMKKAMNKIELEAKRKQTALHIKEKKIAAQKHEENRKSLLLERQERAQKLQTEMNNRREEERKQLKREKEMVARKREYQSKLSRDRQETIKESLIKKFEADEKHLETLKEEREKQQNLVKEEKEIKFELKKENVERIKRIREYKQLETLRKVTENSQRTDELINKKKEMLDQRRKAAQEAKVQKDKLVHQLEKTKSCSEKAIRKMLAQLDKGETKQKRNSKKLKGKSKSTSYIHRPPSMIEIGPPPDVPSLFNKLDTDTRDGKPYQSPYISLR